jgi:hypothetical protein
MRRFPKFRDPRFALTTLQNPNIEVRTYAQLVQAAEQEREWQARAAQYAAPQPPATPAAPDSIPTTASRENVASTAQDPDPTPLAPLDSASPDSANTDSSNPDSADPDSPNDDAQQILDSLVADVVAAGSSAPSSSSDDDEPTAPPTPKPRRKEKKKSRRKSPPHPGNANLPIGAPDTATAAENQPSDEDDSPELSFIERHERKCSICNHPHRQEIDESFLHWRSPQTIMNCFGIKTETTIYHHAHAFNFFALRNRNRQSALANVVENIDNRHFTGSEMLDAVRALAHLSEDGRWIHPTSKSEFMYSMQRLPAVAGLPAATGLPAGQKGLSAVACLPNRQADEPILIASRPNIKNTMQTTENNQQRPNLIASLSAVLAACGRELWARLT